MKSREDLANLANALGAIPVWGCIRGSAMDSAGVKYGDVILSVNGQPTHDGETYMSARLLRKDGMSLSVFRDGTVHNLDVEFTSIAGIDVASLHDLAKSLIDSGIIVKVDSGEPDKKTLN